jgi:hypothetical protein
VNQSRIDRDDPEQMTMIDLIEEDVRSPNHSHMGVESLLTTARRAKGFITQIEKGIINARGINPDHHGLKKWAAKENVQGDDDTHEERRVEKFTGKQILYITGHTVMSAIRCRLRGLPLDKMYTLERVRFGKIETPNKDAFPGAVIFRAH